MRRNHITHNEERERDKERNSAESEMPKDRSCPIRREKPPLEGRFSRRQIPQNQKNTENTRISIAKDTTMPKTLAAPAARVWAVIGGGRGRPERERPGITFYLGGAVVRGVIEEAKGSQFIKGGGVGLESNGGLR